MVSLPTVNQDPNWALQLNAAITTVETEALAAQASADAKVPLTRTITAGTGLTGGGDLSADRTLTVAYGTTGTTATVGNDSRVTGAAQKASNLSDLASAGTARTNLGLGGAAVLNVGTTTGTVAAGDDSRLTDQRTPLDNSVTSTKIVDGTIVNADINAAAAIALSKLATDPLARANHTGTQLAATISDFNTAVATTAALKANNLSDLASAATARTNLAVPPNTRLVTAGTGLTGGGDLSADRTLTVSYGTTSGTATQGNDTRVVNAVQTSGGSIIQSTATNVVPLVLKYIASQSVNLFEWTTSGGTVLVFMAASGNVVYRTGFFSNGLFQVGGETSTAQDGVGVMGLTNATTVPTTNPTGGGILYAQAGALKWRGSSGTVTTIANA